ncbi:MAG TPA: hypothetical protein VF260_12185, partial [Bacilli bacterium]
MMGNQFSANRTAAKWLWLPATMVIVAAMLLLAPNRTQAATTTCGTVSCLQNALSGAQPGDVINLSAGVTFNGTFTASADGTSSSPITLQTDSANPAVVDGGTISSGYALHITGDYWIVKNIKITDAKKGIMLDNANHTLIDGVEVYNIGEEGVH